MIKEVLEKTGSLVPILTIVFGSVSIRSLVISFITSLSYDTFDMRLLPRDKFAVIQFKKNVSVFLIIIPVYCALAFLLAYEAVIFPAFLKLIYVLFFLATVGIILRYLVSFLEFIFIKSVNLRWLHWVRILLGKLSFIYEVNFKTKIYMTLAFLLLSLTMLAYGCITNEDKILTNLTEYLLTMIGISLLLIYSLKPDTKPTDYIFVEENDNLSNLLEKNEIAEELRLEYFLSDSVAVFSTEDRVYRIIKRISEAQSTYELYKTLTKTNG